MSSSLATKFANIDKDPYGVADERRQEKERFRKMKEAAGGRPLHDPRSLSYTDAQIEELVLHGSKVEGAKTAALSLFAFGSMAYAANVYTKFFRKRLGVSGKLAMVVMPTLGLSALAMEHYIIDAHRDKQAFLDRYLGFESPLTEENKPQKDLSLAKRAANMVYNYPYYTLGIGGAAAVGTVFAMQPKELTLQQKVLHSRVMGQMSVLTILCSVMGFMDFMRRRGGEFTE